MYLLNLGKLPGQQSMLVFHALARLVYEGLAIVSPKTPLASIGYLQDAEKEIDLEYCRMNNISVPDEKLLSKIESPGVKPVDFTKAVLAAK